MTVLKPWGHGVVNGGGGDTTGKIKRRCKICGRSFYGFETDIICGDDPCVRKNIILRLKRK